MEVHGTVYYETQRPPEVPAYVKNHGLLPQHELQQLLRKAKVKNKKTLGEYVPVVVFRVKGNRFRVPGCQNLHNCNVHIFMYRFICPQLFIGFGFPYEGPAPLEAIANGCVFLQPKFKPPHSSFNHEFFKGKPTSREVTNH